MLNTIRCLLLACCLGLSLALPALADDTDAPGQTRFAPTRSRAASPFAAAMGAAEAEHFAALAALRAELEQAPRKERASIQRRIEVLKLSRESRLVTLQLGEARRKGNASLANKLTRRLTRLSAAGASTPLQPTGGER